MPVRLGFGKAARRDDGGGGTGRQFLGASGGSSLRWRMLVPGCPPRWQTGPGLSGGSTDRAQCAGPAAIAEGGKLGVVGEDGE